MIIDFHTHTFPDQIAASAVARLSDRANIPAYSSGTAGGLLLACRSDYIRIGRRTVAHTLVALTDTQVGAGGYQALWGGQGKGGRHDVVAAHCTVDPTAGQAG